MRRGIAISEVAPRGEVDEAGLGPAMLALNPQQRKFVVGMIECGGVSHTRPAMEAGYGSGSQESARLAGYRLSHDPKIQVAIREVGLKLLNAGAILAVKTVLEICNDSGVKTKDRLTAAEMIMNRVGMPAVTKHEATVTHKDETTAEMVKRVEHLATQLGLDPQKLLGTLTIDAEFEEIVDDDLGDIF